MLTFSSDFEVDSLFCFTSLPPAAEGVTRRIHEDLRPHLDGIGVFHQTFEPRTAEQLLGMLSLIAEEAGAGSRPILHFDMHGDASRGIEIAPSGEFVSWPELVESLRTINVAAANNLCVVSSACFSMNAIWQVTLSKPCPFFVLIAPEHEVSSGFLEDKTFAFYKSLFDTRDIGAAHKAYLAPTVALHHSQRMLAYVLAGYIRRYCTGKGGNERREQLMTKAVAAGLAHNRADRRRVRQGAKRFTRPSRAMVEHFAKSHAATFQMGTPLGFDIDLVMKLVEIENDEQRRVRAMSQKLGK